MPEIEINDLASLGSIRDVEGYQLPPEAFTLADGMRFTADGVERVGGRQQVFGTPSVAPSFALPVSGAANVFWIYTSLTKAYVWDGSNHTEITRVASNYNASLSSSWNGTILGGIPILNNGTDVPQYWPTISAATKLDDLPNWPAATTAKTIRTFGPYLIAMNLVQGGTAHPHRVLWSHPADPGSVPSSWDTTDPTKDAGENDLPSTQGVLLDGLPLRGHFYLYKEDMVWRMSPIGGTFIFDEDAFLETAGMLAARCVTATADGTRHVFATQDDILVHDGNSTDSILTNRFKRTLFNSIDNSNYRNSFMFTNPFYDEVWFCYPESGESTPTRALIWNYKNGQKGAISETAVDFSYATAGFIESASPDTWSTASGSWDAYFGPWSQSIRRKAIACDPGDTLLLQLDTGSDNEGAPLVGTLQRTGLGVVGRKRNGEWIIDFAKHKLLTRLWIKSSGGTINVRIGFAETSNGGISWSEAVEFNPTTQNFVDITGSGKALAVEFSGSQPFRLLGYKPDITILGNF